MAVLTNIGVPVSLVSPDYLNTSAASHTWPFSAIAELIDNAYDPDVNAKQLWIDKTVIKGQDCLIFMDNGNGMDYNKMHKMLSFGFSDKQAVGDHVPVGRYGSGFKSGSMSLGKDAIVFSKKADTMCVGFLSRTYLEKIDAQTIIVPIVMFTKTGQTGATLEHKESLHNILKHSLFNTEEELLSEFSVDGLFTNSSGTRIIIWNLRRSPSGKLEFDFRKNDVRIPDDVYHSTRETQKREAAGGMSVPESDYSLRAYCSILYLKPRMQIILQGQEVETQFVNLAKVKTDTYKPTCLPSCEKGITITFGYNTKNKEHYGLMMYHNNRLIKAYERVPCQRKSDSRGVGVIGMIECNYLTPTHNKQDFIKTEEYRNTMIRVGIKLEKYWNEVSYHLKANCTEPFEDSVNRKHQLRLRCDNCLKWRKIPDCMYDKKLPENWICSMNSDPQFRSCTVEEEPEDSDEQPRNQKAYRQHKQNQKLQQESRQQSSAFFTPSSSIEMKPKPSDDTSANTQDAFLSTTPKRKKKSKDLTQENPKEKKARTKSFDNIPDLSAPLYAMYSHDSDYDKAKCKDIKTELKDDGDDVIEKSKGKKKKIKQNYKMLYLQAMEEIKQLQHKLREQVKNELKKEHSGVLTVPTHCADTGAYSFLCSHAGQFHCKLTSLVFEMNGNGEVVYTVVSWDNSQLQSMGQFQPAGPLYNIKCPEGSIHYLHLPHCEIHTDKNQIELAVTHFSEGNVEIIQPLKITNTHVILEIEGLSIFGLIKKWIFEKPISAQVLLFYKEINEKQRRRKLNIHLLPGNVPVEEVRKQHNCSTYLECSSICQLIPGKKYRPVCEPYVSQPKIETFGCDYGPNYHTTFEVILNVEVEDLTLSLLDETDQEVWAPRQVIFPADNREAVPGQTDKDAEFVDKHRVTLTQRVSSVMEIADTLLTKEIITNEKYSKIEEATTSQKKMRRLYGFINSAKSKAEFYKVLKKKEKHLVDELESNS